ncbi:MAG: hypothetical protein EZS28_044831 [Streblomastix strix]|uniref:Uncharacterized protein n=1 Tax=Streblomastix strix TaxID=222440 RepID=A0A5J4TP36_9EUKA|nr:MAG: hypothetical protein EZS28_044831 [Streblomastix strix]
MNKDKPSSQLQQPATPIQKPTHRGGQKQKQKKDERELQQIQASQQLLQQENYDLNFTDVDTSEIQGTVGQLTEDNAEEEEDEQSDESSLIQNKDYRVNVILQPQVQENLGKQPQDNQGLNALNQVDKDNTGPVPIGEQEKPKKSKGSRKTKIECLNASDEPSQRNNAKTQTKTASTVPKPKAAPKRGRKKANRAPDRTGTLQPRGISVETSFQNSEEKRADEDCSSGDGGKDWRIDIQRKGE